MKRRTLLRGAAATLAATPLSRPHAQKPVTVRWWYHFDDPKATPDELVAAFQKEHPDIKIEPENIPWGGGGDYDNRLYTSIIAGNGPDTAMVKFNNLARLIEMDAIVPLDKWIDAWAARSDISADLWRLHTAPDGKRYYMPLQYVVLYLYVRLDLLAKQNLKPPTNFDEFLNASKALTGGELWGFGVRGGSGGHDSWMPFAFGTGAKPVRGGFVSPQALAQNRYFIDLYRTHKVCPPSAPTDAFLQIVNNLKSGRVAMTVTTSARPTRWWRRSATTSPRYQSRAVRTKAASPPSATAPTPCSAPARTQRPPGRGSPGSPLAPTTCCTTRPLDR